MSEIELTVVGSGSEKMAGTSGSEKKGRIDSFLAKVVGFEKWLGTKGVGLAGWLGNRPGTTLEKRKKVLKASSVFGFFALSMLIWELKGGAKVHYAWFSVPILAPFLVTGAGALTIEAVYGSQLVKDYSVVADVFFFLMSTGISLSIGFTGLGSLPLVLLGCVFLIWACLIEMVFDLATPIALVTTIVSATISFTINIDGVTYDLLVAAPVVLALLLIVLSWRYKASLFLNQEPLNSVDNPMTCCFNFFRHSYFCMNCLGYSWYRPMLGLDTSSSSEEEEEIC